MMAKKHWTVATLAGLVGGAALVASAELSAAGFALVEQSASGQGNAFAGATAAAEDASTIFFNPAGMTRIRGRQAVAGLHWISPQSDFTNDGSHLPAALGGGALTGGGDDGGKDAFVPNLYYLQPVGDDLVAGIGINVPFGLSTEYDAGWVGRYHAIESEVTTVNVNPSLAWRVNDRLSVGGGVSAQYIDVTLTSAIDLGALCFATTSLGPTTCSTFNATPQNADGFADLSGDDWSYGFNLGLMFEPTPDSRLGVAYRSKVSHSLSGEARFSGTNTAATTVLNAFASAKNLVDTSLTADVTLPESVAIGYYQQVSERLALMADWTWTHWQRFSELRIDYASAQADSVTTEAWRNSSRYSLGANYRVDEALLLRAGIAYDETPVPDAQHRTARIPGNDRRWVSLGFNWAFSSTSSLDLGYSHLFVSRTPVDETPSSGHVLKGSYDSSVDIVSLQFNWRY